MYLNEFAVDLEALDMSSTEEFQSLLRSAADLGIPHDANVRYSSRHTVVEQQRFHYLEWGDPDAPPVLLLHGGNQSAHSWDLVSLHLADRYHVYAFDQRGHGDSEWARDENYSSAQMARDAHAFVVQQGADRPLVMGHSMGGMVTMRMLVDNPQLARAAVFVDVGPEISGPGSRMIRDFITQNVEFDDIEEFVQRVAAYDPYRTREHIERTVRYNMLRRADGKYVAKSDRILHDPERRKSARDGGRGVSVEDVATIACPTLVVRGGSSNVLEAEPAVRFAAALADGELVTVPDCGHNVHTQNTPGFLAAIQPFLAKVEAAVAV